MFQMQSTKMLINGHRWERKKVSRLSEKYPPCGESGFEGETGDLT